MYSILSIFGGYLFDFDFFLYFLLLLSLLYLYTNIFICIEYGQAALSSDCQVSSGGTQSVSAICPGSALVPRATSKLHQLHPVPMHFSTLPPRRLELKYFFSFSFSPFMFAFFFKNDCTLSMNTRTKFIQERYLFSNPRQRDILYIRFLTIFHRTCRGEPGGVINFRNLLSSDPGGREFCTEETLVGCVRCSRTPREYTDRVWDYFFPPRYNQRPILYIEA